MLQVKFDEISIDEAREIPPGKVGSDLSETSKEIVKYVSSLQPGMALKLTGPGGKNLYSLVVGLRKRKLLGDVSLRKSGDVVVIIPD